MKMGFKISGSKTQIDKGERNSFMPLLDKNHKRFKGNAECKHKEGIYGNTKKKNQPKE
jgi:hypothetical protein